MDPMVVEHLSILIYVLQVPQDPRTGQHGEGFIYIYDLPPKFNKDGEQLETTWHSDQYDYDVLLHKYLAESPYCTHEPEKAKLFFLPLYLGRRFSHGWTWPNRDVGAFFIKGL
jgi:hypothetical protein